MIDIEFIRNYCISKPAVEECFPFDSDTLVFKVMNKMFAVLPLERQGMLILKCSPDYAIDLRETYSEIEPAWHFNKRHWNQLDLSGGLKTEFICGLIDHSYNLVVEGLPRRLREKLDKPY